MKEDNIILQKTYAFGLRILKLYLHLRKNRVDSGICSQILNSGTSIGANVEEAVGGSSKKDFINKLQIAYREARETRYWLSLLKDADILQDEMANSFISDCNEIIKILTAILNSSKKKKS